MEKNIGNVDKVVRILVAFMIAGIGIYSGMWFLFIVALIPLLEIGNGYSGLYTKIGINTNKKSVEESLPNQTNAISEATESLSKQNVASPLAEPQSQNEEV